MSQQVNSLDVASMFLRALGAQDTPAMRRAVAIWLKFESGGTVTGNNPWNLHSGSPCPATRGYCPGQGNLPGQIGNRYAGPGDRNVAVFGTLQAGVTASAQNLIRLSPSYGYGKVIAAARRGDAIGFLIALQNSAWSAGHYSYSKLVSAFKGSNSYSYAITLRPVGGGTSNVSTPNIPSLTDVLKSLGISTDQAHKLTDDEIRKIAKSQGVPDASIPLYISRLHGMTVADLSKIWGSTTPIGSPIPGADLIPDIPGAIAGFGAAIGKLVSYILAVVLILAGLWLYSKSGNQQQINVEVPSG